MPTHAIYFFSQEQYDIMYDKNSYGTHEFEKFINGNQYTEVKEFTDRNNPPKSNFSDAKVVAIKYDIDSNKPNVSYKRVRFSQCTHYSSLEDAISL